MPDARDFDVGRAGLTILIHIPGPLEPAPFGDIACARDLLGSEATILLDLAAMGACGQQAGLGVEVRGWHRGGRLSLNCAGNLQQHGAAALASR